MFRPSNSMTLDFGPIDFPIEVFIHQSTHDNVIASDHEHTALFFDGRLVVVGIVDDAFDRVV